MKNKNKINFEAKKAYFFKFFQKKRKVINPLVVNIFYDYEGHTYPEGVAPLSKVYDEQGLMFSMQMFGSDGSVEQYLIVWATPGKDWDHKVIYP